MHPLAEAEGLSGPHVCKRGDELCHEGKLIGRELPKLLLDLRERGDLHGTASRGNWNSRAASNIAASRERVAAQPVCDSVSECAQLHFVAAGHPEDIRAMSVAISTADSLLQYHLHLTETPSVRGCAAAIRAR